MRYFIAIDIEDFESICDTNTMENLRVPNNHHLTLQFFGSIEKEDIEWIKKKLDSFSFDTLTFTTHNFTSAFPNWNNPNTIYVGVENKQLQKLAFQLRSLLKERFVGKEFVPHITLGRVKKKVEEKEIDLLRKLQIKPLTLHVSSINLYKSTFDENGVSYTLLKKTKLN